MRRALKTFVEGVNFKIAVALRQKVPVLEIISALEKIAADLDGEIEKRVQDKEKK